MILIFVFIRYSYFKYQQKVIFQSSAILLKKRGTGDFSVQESQIKLFIDIVGTRLDTLFGLFFVKCEFQMGCWNDIS